MFAIPVQMYLESVWGSERFANMFKTGFTCDPCPEIHKQSRINTGAGHGLSIIMLE